jgi:hypothetical protein
VQVAGPSASGSSSGSSSSSAHPAFNAVTVPGWDDFTDHKRKKYIAARSESVPRTHYRNIWSFKQMELYGNFLLVNKEYGFDLTFLKERSLLFFGARLNPGQGAKVMGDFLSHELGFNLSSNQGHLAHHFRHAMELYLL